MKVKSKQTPQWAIDLVKQVCDDHNRGLPGELRWRNTDNSFSSGCCHYAKDRRGNLKWTYKISRSGTYKRVRDTGYIQISAGTNLDGQRIVLLHEIGHWLTARKRGKEGHTVRFWRIAWDLYHQYSANIEQALKSESNYKKFASVVYSKYYGDKEE